MIHLTKSHQLLIISLILAIVIMVIGGLKERETAETINLIVTLSATMAGFGLVAFQIAQASNELKNDFIDSSILMILSTLAGFFYLLYPTQSLLNFNFGEVSIFLFFWAFCLFLIVLVDKRLKILR